VEREVNFTGIYLSFGETREGGVFSGATHGTKEGGSSLKEEGSK